MYIYVHTCTCTYTLYMYKCEVTRYSCCTSHLSFTCFHNTPIIQVHTVLTHISRENLNIALQPGCDASVDMYKRTYIHTHDVWTVCKVWLVSCSRMGHEHCVAPFTKLVNKSRTHAVHEPSWRVRMWFATFFFDKYRICYIQGCRLGTVSRRTSLTTA